MSCPGTVSVVIPTYNRADVLGKSIDSALAQTYDDVEVFVVDDASTDDTEQLVERYGDDVLYHCLEENQGANAARNRGIERADGAFVAFLDADDYWRPEKLERQIQVFENASDNCGLVHTAIEIQNFDGETIDKVPTESPDDPKRRLLLGDYVGTFSCVVVKSQVFDNIEPLRRDLPSWQDWEFYLRIADEYDFRAVDDHLTIKRSGKDDQISKNLKPLLDTTYPFFESKIRRDAEAYGAMSKRRSLARLRMAVGDAALVNRDAKTARTYFLRGLVVYPFEPKLVIYFFLSLFGTDAYDNALKLRRMFSI